MIFGLFYFKLEIYQPLLVLFVISTSSIFSFLMYQPTEKGQRMIEYLEGLKMFLTTTQMPALKQKGIEGKLTEKGMEELFPYAMALGLEKEWERKFKKLFDIEHMIVLFILTRMYPCILFALFISYLSFK